MSGRVFVGAPWLPRHGAGALTANLLLVAHLLAGAAHASVPPGADGLASYGAWSVFQYPLDPWRRCWIGSEPTRFQGAARLLVDVGADDVSIIRRSGGTGSGEETRCLGAPSLWVCGRSCMRSSRFSDDDDGYDEVPDEHIIQIMKASEAEARDTEMMVRGETWRGVEVTDTFSLHGFTAAHDAANGRVCKPRQPSVEMPSSVELSSVDVESSGTSSDEWHTEVRLLGPFFRRGSIEALTISAIPNGRDERFGGLSFVDARLDFYRGESVIGREEFDYYMTLANICVSPESGRLEIIVTSSAGGSGGWTDSHFLFFDPDTGRVVSAKRGTHGEEIYEEIEWVDTGSFVPYWCPYRGHLSRVDSFSREIMKEWFVHDAGASFERLDEVDRIVATRNFRHETRSPDGGHIGFADDVFSAYLERILQSGPDSPLQFERFDTSRFSVVDMRHSGYSFRDAFQMIFVKEAAGVLWTPIYHAGPDNSLERYKLAEVSGFLDEETLRLHMCMEECVPWEWGEYADVNFNLRTFEGVIVDVAE